MQGAIGTRVLRPHVVYGMATVSLNLYDAPQLAIWTREDTDVGGLPTAFRKYDGIMEDDLDERLGRRGGRLLLLALTTI